MPRVVIKAGCDDDSSKFKSEINPNYLNHWSTTDYFVFQNKQILFSSTNSYFVVKHE